jgi:hypothetical protein
MRRHESGIGCGARVRGSQPRTREAPGPRSGGTTAAPRGASLDWERPNGFRRGLRSATGVEPALQEPSRKPERKPGNAAPGTEIAATERREAPAFPQGSAGRWKTGASLGAPSPRYLRGAKEGPLEAGKDYGVPGAAKNTGGEACARRKAYPRFRSSKDLTAWCAAADCRQRFVTVGATRAPSCPQPRANAQFRCMRRHFFAKRES